MRLPGDEMEHSHRKHTHEDFRTRQARRNGAVPIEGSGKSYWLFDEDDPNRVRAYELVVQPW